MNRTNIRAAARLLLAALIFSPALAPSAFAQKSPESERETQKGAQYLAQRDWKRALDSYTKAAHADPRNYEARY